MNKEGNFVLLKNGTWKEYSDLSELTDNDNYARTVDGYLRLKTVNKEWGPGYKYFNWKVRHNLYSYIPQKTMASLLSWRFSKNGKSANNGIHYIPEPIGNIMDVEIGLKNLEGTDYVVVEQTDSDYPVPFTYIIDNPLCGRFLTNMNRLYTSKFKITYVNANGQTTGDAFTLDLAGKDTLVPLDPESINIYDKVIEFSSSATTNYQNLKYVISDINKGCVAKKGDVDLLNDSIIDISTLPKSLYSISLYNDNNEKVGNLKWIKH